MMIQAVVFDAADTLFTTRGAVGEIYASVARDFGSKAPAEVIHAAFLRQFRGAGPLSTEHQKAWWKDVVHRVFSEVGMVKEFDRFFDQVYDKFRDSQSWVLFPETSEVLGELKGRGLKLGVLSNFDDRIYSVMRSLDILSFFDSVIISSETGFCKPDVRIFEAAANALQTSANHILFVGDSLTDDVEAGLRAGLQAVLLDRKGRHVAANHVRKISSLTEVAALVS
jgi:putative hydrolase of the HAD superfamily